MFTFTYIAIKVILNANLIEKSDQQVYTYLLCAMKLHSMALNLPFSDPSPRSCSLGPS